MEKALKKGIAHIWEVLTSGKTAITVLGVVLVVWILARTEDTGLYVTLITCTGILARMAVDIVKVLRGKK